MLYCLLETPKTHAVFVFGRGGGGGCSVVNALNLEKRGLKTKIVPFHWTFLPFCSYTARMPLFSRISPAFTSAHSYCTTIFFLSLISFAREHWGHVNSHFYTVPFLPLNSKFFKKGGNKNPWFHLTVFVKSAHMQTFTKKARNTFGLGTFCFFCKDGNTWFLLWSKGSFTCHHQSSRKMEVWSKPHYVYFSTW